MNRSAGAMIISAAALLAGCGGGGGSSSSSSGGSSGSGSGSTAVTVQMQSALKKFSQNSTVNNFNVSGWIGNNGQKVTVSGNGTVSISAPQADGSFNEAVTGTVNGTSFSESLNVPIPFGSAPTTVSAGVTGTMGNASYTVTADGSNALLITITATSSTGTAAQGQVTMTYKIDTSNNVTLVSSEIQESVAGVEVLDITLTF